MNRLPPCDHDECGVTHCLKPLPEWLQDAIIAGQRERNEKDFVKAQALWSAGWTAETPHASQDEIMSFYWRRPGKRKGKKGRLFLSTDQAYNHLIRTCTP